MASEIEFVPYKDFVEGLPEATDFAPSDKSVVSNSIDGPRNIVDKNIINKYVGVGESAVDGTALSAGTHKYIVYPSGALSGNTDSYRYLKIPVVSGQILKVTGKTKSLGASIFAVYNGDDSLSQIYMQSAINVTETFTHTVSGSESYALVSSHVDVLSSFNAVFGATALNLRVKKLEDDVSSLESSVENIEDELPRIDKIYSIGTFYRNAWVRFSDGYISNSSGGAKLYIIKKSEVPKGASKILADVCTESTTFAAIAFYSGETPSTSNYMQSSSVQGVNSNNTEHFEAQIPQNWGCCVVLNMSQHQASYKINLDVPACPGVEEVVSIAKNYSNEAKSLVNIFSKKPLYHHLDPDAPAANQSIPSQSLFDVAYASALGFDFIEANLHKCSDDVFVCKHGISGKLGRGLKSVNGTLTPEEVADISFADVTSEWLRENVVYDCVDASFNSFIPTFDEFCSECKKYGLGIKFEGMDALSIARKYFPDDRLFINSEVRGEFKGTVEIVWKPSTETIDAAIGRALVVGAPCQIVIAAGSDIYNIDLKSVCQKVHSNGLLIGIVYPKTNDVLYALENGVDAVCTTYRAVNTFDNGDLFNIGRLDDSRLVLTSATYDSETKTIQMSSGGTIVLNFESAEAFAKVCARLRYSGNLTISCGVNSDYYNLEECESEGSRFVEVALAIAQTSSNQSFTRAITITANESTVVYGLKINVGRTI